MSKIQEELVELTEVKQKRKENEQEYLYRLAEATSNAADSDWDELSEEAQQWVNDAIQAKNDDEDIPEFPDGDEPEEDLPEDEPEEEADPEEEPAEEDQEGEVEDPEEDDGEEEDTRKRGRKVIARKTAKSVTRGRPVTKVADKPKRVEQEVPRKARATKNDKPLNMRQIIIGLVCKKPKSTVEELCEKAKKAGVHMSPTAVAAIRSGARTQIRVMNDLGITDLNL